MGILDGLFGKTPGSPEGGAGNQDNDIIGSLLGSLGGAKDQGAGLMASAMSLLQSSGGLNAVLERFRANGMMEQVESWIGTGPNKSITVEQIHKIFDSAAIRDVAARLGVSADQAGSSLAALLPELVNRLTPQGKVPDNHQDLIAEGLAKLKTWTT